MILGYDSQYAELLEKNIYFNNFELIRRNLALYVEIRE